MNWKRSRTKSIFNGLPLRTIPKLFIVPWDCTIMVLTPNPVLPTSGFLLQFRIRGIRNLFLKTSLQPTKIPLTMPQRWDLHVSSPLMLWDITLVDDLIQRANSMALAAHLIAHDAGVRSSELFTHLHMLRRHTVLESPTVDLPQRDQNRLIIMSIGGNDLFGPDARKVHEWKRDTDEEKVKLISRVFDEREQRDKAKKKPSSSTSGSPLSLSHRSPLESFPSPRPKDSYNQQRG